MITGSEGKVSSSTNDATADVPLMQAGKMLALQGVLSGLVHELNNPNHIVMFNVDLLTQFLEDIMPVLDAHAQRVPGFEMSGMPYSDVRSDLTGVVRGIRAGGERIRRVSEILSLLFRTGDDSYRVKTDLNAVVQSVLLLVQSRLRNATDNFVLELDENQPCAHTHPGLLGQILINLLVHAGEKTQDRHSTIRLRTRRSSCSEAYVIVEYGCVAIGPGQAPTPDQALVLSENQRRSLGLHITAAQNMATNIGASLKLEASESGGTLATVCLPIDPHGTQAQQML